MNSKNDFFAIVIFLVAFVVIAITWYLASTNANIDLTIEQTKTQLIVQNIDTDSDGVFPGISTINEKSVNLEFER